MFAKLAKAVTFADFPDLMTPMVKRRFQLRGLTNIEMRDVRRLDGRRYDIVNCMDVVEHVYDVEDITADLIARLRPGGHLLCWPCFVNHWNGDQSRRTADICRTTPICYWPQGLSLLRPYRRETSVSGEG